MVLKGEQTMKEVKLVRPSKIKVILDGEQYEFRKPKIGEQLDLEKRVKEAKDGVGDLSAIYIDFFEQCGLPREMILGLETDLLVELAHALEPEKKKA